MHSLRTSIQMIHVVGVAIQVGVIRSIRSKAKGALLNLPAPSGLELHLASLRKSSPADLASGPQFVGNNIVHPTAKIGKDCKIGPNVSIGIECEIGDGARITSSVLLHRVHVSISSVPGIHQEGT